MHQEHNVPWNLVASHFKFVRDNPHYTPRTTGLFARQLPTQADNLNHFKRVLHKTITTFSETERQKYNATFPAPTSGSLFSDDLRDRHCEFLDKWNQSIKFWIKSAEPSYYSTSNAELADAVKVLISENKMEPLLMLAKHPRIPLGGLCHLHWGHWFGFSRIMESALHAYIDINLWHAMGLLEGGEYLELADYSRMVYNATVPFDFPGHQVPHRAYLNALPKDEKTGLPILHRDYEGLKEYMKTNFRLLYRYDMLMRECGMDPQWENEIVKLFRYPMGARVKIKRGVEEDGKYNIRFA